MPSVVPKMDGIMISPHWASGLGTLGALNMVLSFWTFSGVSGRPAPRRTFSAVSTLGPWGRSPLSSLPIDAERSVFDARISAIIGVFSLLPAFISSISSGCICCVGWVLLYSSKILTRLLSLGSVLGRLRSVTSFCNVCSFAS